MKRIAAVASTVFIVVLVAVLILLPSGIKWWIHKNSPELIGRKVEMDKLRVNYFKGSVRILDFTLYEQNNQDEFIGFDEFFIDFDLFHLLRKQIAVASVRLIGSRVHIQQHADTFNFSDLVEHFKDTTSLDVDTVRTKDQGPSFLDKYGLRVRNFSVENAALYYQDLEYNEHVGFDSINFSLPEFTWGDSSSLATLDLQFATGGSLRTSVFLDMDADVFAIDIDIDSLSIEPANLYIMRNDYYNIQDISGRLTQQIHMEGDPNHPLNATHSGHIEVENFSIIDERGNEFLAFEKLQFDFDTLNWADKVLLVNHLTLVRPSMKIEVLKETNTLAMLVDLPDSLAAEVPPEEEKKGEEEPLAVKKMSEDAQRVTDYTAGLLHLDEYTYRVDSIVIREGKYTLIDRSLTKGMQFEVNHFNLKTEGFGMDQFRMQAQGIVNRSGKMSIQIEKIPKEKLAFNVIYALNSLKLDDFSPYTIHFTGSPVEFGNMDLYSVSAIRGNTLASENSIDFHDLEFGKKQQKGVYNLPVKFVVSLLKNPAGDIELDIPVEGSLDDPDFRLGKEIMQAILNVSFNVVASPVKFIAKMFKKDEKELSELDYQYLRPELIEKEIKTLEDLRQILKVKTGINVKVVQCGDYEMAMGKYALYRAKSNYYKDLNRMGFDSTLAAYDSLQISEIADDDSLFLAYINEKVQNRELNLEEKSIDLFGEVQIREEMDSLLEKRNEYIRGYFRQEPELTDERIRVLNADFDTLSTENMRPYYQVNFVPPDE